MEKVPERGQLSLNEEAYKKQGYADGGMRTSRPLYCHIWKKVGQKVSHVARE